MKGGRVLTIIILLIVGKLQAHLCQTFYIWIVKLKKFWNPFPRSGTVMGSVEVWEYGSVEV